MIDKSFFVSATIHKRDVMLPDGSTHVLFFKEVPAVEVRKFSLAEQSEDMDIRANAIAPLIAASLCTESGEEVITLDQARSLNSVGANALFAPIIEVNGLQRGKQGKG